MGLKVSEIFYSLQGEGTHVGRPAIFIRLAGCNRSCLWCDEKEKPFKRMSIDSVMVKMAELNQKINDRCPPVIFTGGEPMLQESALFQLLITIREYYTPSIWVETNGDIFNRQLCVKYIDFVSMSLKLRNAGEKTIIMASHLSWLHYSKHYEIKLVITHKEDFKEVKKIKKSLSVPAYSIRLMKEKNGSTRLQEEIVKEALEQGYSVTPRLQDIWHIK